MSWKQIIDHISKGQIPSPALFPDPVVDALASLSSLRGRRSPLSAIERLVVSFQRKEPDHVPCAPLLGGAYRQLTGASFKDFSLDADVAIEAGLLGLDLIGGDVLLLGLDLTVEASDFGQKTIYPENSTAHPDYNDPLLKDHTDYRKLKRIELKDAPRMTRVVNMAKRALKERGRKAIFVPVVSSPLSVLGMMRGAERVFKDCALYPNEVMAAMETVTGVLIDYINALCDTGLIIICPDMLYSARSGIGKELWEKIEGPFGREIADVIHRRKRLVAIHNCGDGPYFDSMIKFMAPDAISYARLPEDCKDRKELKRKYGDQVVLIGDIETPILHRGTPAQVIDECRQCIDELAEGGGFILAPGCEYPPNISLLNAMLLVEAARVYG
jgi:uroporphyrinogen decarboxylase